VCELAAGRLEAAGYAFISAREASVERNQPRYVADQLRQVAQATSAGTPRPKTFEEVLRLLAPQIPAMIRQRLTNAMPSEAIEMGARIDQFPAIRASVRADIHLWATPIIHGVGAAIDKIDDYRHIIEAAYADVFVTGDLQLAAAVPRIHPGLRVVTWHELSLPLV
jgi:hypothetical protein